MTLIYKCRMCSGITEGHSGPQATMFKALCEFPGERNASFSELYLPKNRLCHHKDQSVGIADLIGAKKEPQE